MIVVAVLVVLGAAVLLGVRRRRGGSVHPRSDSLARAVLGASVHLVPASESEWVAAMLAEHDQIDDVGERRRFARGCVLAMARRSVRGDRTADGFRVVALTAIAACAALAVFGLIHYPGLRDGPAWIVYLTLFTLGLSLYAVLACSTAGLGSRAARVQGLAMGALIGAGGWFAASHSSSSGVAVTQVVLVLPALVAWLTARRNGSAAGLVAGVWTALTGALMMFVGFVATTYVTGAAAPTTGTLREFAASGAPNYTTWAIGDALGGACFLLLLLPAVGSVLAAIVASIAGGRHDTAAARLR
jgi:hypothetical protein